MADSLLDNYNPLYDIHLRQYFALPHMQKHLQKMGLLESTLNLNGDEVYARHHAMMDMMLKNREAQLMKMAELRKKLDAAEKVECCRRIRTGQSPESYRQGKPSRSLSRNRARGTIGSEGRHRRYSNSFEDRDYVQRIEEQNADPVEQNNRDPYKRLSANAKRFNYLHKLDDNTLVSYKDNLKKQLQRLERFREISFGPHSVARQPPPPQASWFFRRRSVLNIRGRKATTGNKLNATHESRTSCPPTTRKRKDSNSRLPPIHPQKNRIPTKPPVPLSLQQVNTKLPPAARKPAPTRGRSSNKRQTTTTTTTTITAVSKSPQISNTNSTTLPALPSVAGHGIFTGAAAAATAAAIGTAAINIDGLINEEQLNDNNKPSSPRSPVLETQKTFDRSSPTDEEVPSDILEKVNDDSEYNSRHVVDNAPIDTSHGDYENSDSEPEYAEEDSESRENILDRQEEGITVASPEELYVHVHQERESTISPVTDIPEKSLNELDYHQYKSPSPEIKEIDSPTATSRSTTPPSLNLTKQLAEEVPQSPVIFEHQAQQSPVVDVLNTHVVEHFETHDSTPQSPVLSVHEEAGKEEERSETPISPVLLLLNTDQREEPHDSPTQSPKMSALGSHVLEQQEDDHKSAEKSSGPHSPISSMYTSHTTDQSDAALPIASEKDVVELSPSIYSSQASEEQDAAPHSPVLSDRSASSARSATLEYSVETGESGVSNEPFDHSEIPQRPVDVPEQHSPGSQNSAGAPSPVLSIHRSYPSENQELDTHSSMATSELYELLPAAQSPVLSEKDAASEDALSIHNSPQLRHGVDDNSEQTLNQDDFTIVEHQAVGSPVNAPYSSQISPKELEKDGFERASSVEIENVEHSERSQPENALQSPVNSEKEMKLERASSVHTSGIQSPNAISPRDIDEHVEHIEHTNLQEGVSDVPDATIKSPIASVELTEPVPESPKVFIPESPSVHSSDAEQETYDVQHHAASTHSQSAIPRSPTEMDLYNPSSGPQDSPIMSDNEDNVTTAIPIADRIEMEAYHDSPTKESTSPVAVNPIEVHVSAEQVSQQLATPEQKFNDVINQSVEEEALHPIQKALTETPGIIEEVNTYEEKEKLPDGVHEHYTVPDAMMTSMYQAGSDNEDEPTPDTKDKNEASQHFKESTANSEHTNDNAPTEGSESVNSVNGHDLSPGSPEPDNLSTDSLIIHDDIKEQPDQMTQSVYQHCSDSEDTQENAWDDGTKNVHEAFTKQTDESAEHSPVPIGTAATVIKSGEDMKNNNDDAESDDDENENIKEENEHGSNGNSVHETVATTTHSVTSGGFPEGGILVDDGDEKNISSL